MSDMPMVWTLQCAGCEFRIEIANGVMLPTFNGRTMHSETIAALADCMAQTAERMRDATKVNIGHGGVPS